MRRRLFIATSVTAALSACGPISNKLNGSEAFRKVLESAEPVNHALIGTRGMARQYRDADVDREFRVNGFSTPADANYQRLAAGNFVAYRLIVDGAVENRRVFSLAELNAMPP